MTDAKQEASLTKYEQHLKEIYLDGLWEKFCLTGRPADLASFVRLGGDINGQEKRDIIADLLKATPHKNPGGAKPDENIETYLAVLKLMASGVKKTPAIECMAVEKNIAPQSCWDRYNAGAKLLGGETTRN
ncbi:MAG: hypothetical protein HOO00_08885 [Rhodospirillaceae bacterium]|jgi:hypothetical protein|nr:hypothetical protein [Rhodospirillaceae bacterium]